MLLRDAVLVLAPPDIMLSGAEARGWRRRRRTASTTWPPPVVAQRSGRVYLFGLEKAAGAYVRRDGDERGEEEREGMRRGEERRGERRREEREGGKEERLSLIHI